VQKRLQLLFSIMGYYIGEVMNACGAVSADFSDTNIVAVTGDFPNPGCGHLLLNTGSGGGYYFHVIERKGYPRYMNGTGYSRFLKESGKSELNRLNIAIPDQNGALTKLESLMSNTWTWWVLPNNCVSFVEEVLDAGGSDWSSITNCPALAADVIPNTVQRFYQQMTTRIYQLYGVPQ
jgi:hypothetical protein